MTRGAHDTNGAWRKARSSSTASCCARGAGARERAWRVGLPDRARRGGHRRAARRWCCGSSISPSISARRAMRCGARWRRAARSARSSRPARLRDDGPLAVAADEEALPFRDGALDLVVSALSLQFVNDLPGALVQIRRALRPDGLLLAALLGGDTLTELRQAFAQAEAEIEDGDLAAGRAVRRSARPRRAAAARGLCAAGHRRRPAHRALRVAARA